MEVVAINRRIETLGRQVDVRGLLYPALVGVIVRKAGDEVQNFWLFGPGGFPVVQDTVNFAILLVARVFALGFTLSAPFFIAAF